MKSRMRDVLALTSLMLLLPCAHAFYGILLDDEFSGTQIYVPSKPQKLYTNLSFDLQHIHGAAAVVLHNDVYIMGGQQTGLAIRNNVFIFNTTTNETYPLHSMNTERVYHAATIFNESILVCGGETNTQTLSSTTCEIYEGGLCVCLKTLTKSFVSSGKKSLALRNTNANRSVVFHNVNTWR
jgi:hypothetical protein